MPKLTGKVAQEIGVTSQTIRSWSSRFSKWLTPEASHLGQTRYFTNEDVELLKAVAHFRSLNLSYNEVADKLESGAHLALEEVTAEPPPEPPTALITMEQVRAMISPLAAAADEWRAIALERAQEVASLREENRRLRQELTRSWWRRLLGR